MLRSPDEKAARTPTEAKISSSLLTTMKQRRGLRTAAVTASLRSTAALQRTLGRNGEITIDVKGEIDKALINAIETLGGQVLYATANTTTLRARLPIDRLDALAEANELRFIRPATLARAPCCHYGPATTSPRAPDASAKNCRSCSINDPSCRKCRQPRTSASRRRRVTRRTARIAPARSLASTVHFSLTVSYSLSPLSPQTFEFDVQTGQPAPTATFTYSGPALPIPDANAAGVNVPITVSGFAGAVSGMTLSINGTTCTATQGATRRRSDSIIRGWAISC